MQYYFAYGSNMDQKQMTERCPDAALVGPAILKDYRLAFTIFSPKRQCGCADVIKSAGDLVYGLLYQLTDEDAARMDVFEGAPTHYHRTLVEVNVQDKTVGAFTYEVVNKIEGLKPSAHYLGLITSAAKKFEFPLEYRNFLSTFAIQVG